MTLDVFPPILQSVSVTIKSVQPTRVSQAHNLKQQMRTTSAQRWGIQIVFPPLTKAQFMPYYAFLLKHRGQADPFTIVVPGFHTPLGHWVGEGQSFDSLVDARHVMVFGLDYGNGLNKPNSVKAGDLIKFANHGKVYMVTQDAPPITTNNTPVMITIEPPLLLEPGYRTPITAYQVPFTVVNASDTLETTLSPGMYHSLTLDLVEKL
jgi:hypothetical protein